MKLMFVAEKKLIFGTRIVVDMEFYIDNDFSLCEYL